MTRLTVRKTGSGRGSPVWKLPKTAASGRATLRAGRASRTAQTMSPTGSATTAAKPGMTVTLLRIWRATNSVHMIRISGSIRSGGSGVPGVRRAAITPTSKRGRSCLAIRMRLPKSLHRRSRRQSRGSWRTASSSTSPSCSQTGTGCSLRRQRRRRRSPSGPARTTAQRGRCAAA